MAAVASSWFPLERIVTLENGGDQFPSVTMHSNGNKFDTAADAHAHAHVGIFQHNIKIFLLEYL